MNLLELKPCETNQVRSWLSITLDLLRNVVQTQEQNWRVRVVERTSTECEGPEVSSGFGFEKHREDTEKPMRIRVDYDGGRTTRYWIPEVLLP